MANVLTFPEIEQQAASEERQWVLDVKNIITTPASPVVNKIVDMTTGTDVKATVMPGGSPSVSGTRITLPVIKLLTIGIIYRVHVTYTDGGLNKFESSFMLKCPF